MLLITSEASHCTVGAQGVRSKGVTPIEVSVGVRQKKEYAQSIEVSLDVPEYRLYPLSKIVEGVQQVRTTSRASKVHGWLVIKGKTLRLLLFVKGCAYPFFCQRQWARDVKGAIQVKRPYPLLPLRGNKGYKGYQG